MNVVQLPALQLALDLLGIFAFAVAGGLAGVRRGLDLFGVVVLACVTALGGGVVRDIILQTQVVGASDWRFVAVACGAGLIAFLAADFVERMSRPIRTLDAVGLALFCVSGSLKALGLGASPTACVVLGVVTAVGGGILRDVLLGVVPHVLRAELYAVPALLGSLVVVIAAQLGELQPSVIAAAVALTFVVRMVAIVLRLQAPHRRFGLEDNITGGGA